MLKIREAILDSISCKIGGSERRLRENDLDRVLVLVVVIL